MRCFSLSRVVYVGIQSMGTILGLPVNCQVGLKKILKGCSRHVCLMSVDLHDWFSIKPKGHATPLFINLHWLPVAARIQHKALTLACEVTSGSAPTYLNVILNAYIPSRALRSSNMNHLAVLSLKTKRGHSKLFLVVVPQWWNNLPVATRAAISLSTFKKLVKTLLF